jgi:hypothetical protein
MGYSTYKWRWSFIMHQIRKNGSIAMGRSAPGDIGLYDCVRRVIVAFLFFFSFSSLILALAAQEVCA